MKQGVVYMQITNLLDEMEMQHVIDSATRKFIENRKNDNDGNGQNGKNNGVSLEISNEAIQKYMEQFLLQQNMEATKQQGEAAKDYADEFGKVMTIYRRIAKGDKVPGKDEKKLLEYSKELYQAAKMAAAMAKNKKPKKYKSVDDDEKAMENRGVEAMGPSNTNENEIESCAEDSSMEETTGEKE